jgi:hypothetical protein
MRAPLCVALVAAAAAEAAPSRNPPDAYVQKLDCLVRQLAFEYAQNKTKTHLDSVYDALNLRNCTNFLTTEQLAANERELHSSPDVPAHAQTDPSQLTVFVSTTGSDANTGTASLPFATLQRARDEIRTRRQGHTAVSAEVSIRGGKYFLNTTLQLDARDSNVRFAATNQEKVILSGGLPLHDAPWQPSSRPGVLMTSIILPKTDSESSADTGRCSDPSAYENGTDFSEFDVAHVAVNATTAPEMCCAACATNAECTAWTFGFWGKGGSQGFHCCLKNGTAGRRHSNGHTSGTMSPDPRPPTPGPAPGPAPAPGPGPHPPTKHDFGRPPALVNSLFVKGARRPRARYPDGDPQADSGRCFHKTADSGGCLGYRRAADASLQSRFPRLSWMNTTGDEHAPPSHTFTLRTPYAHLIARTGYVQLGPNRGASPTLGCGEQCEDYGVFRYTLVTPFPGHPVYTKVRGWRQQCTALYGDMLYACLRSSVAGLVERRHGHPLMRTLCTHSAHTLCTHSVHTLYTHSALTLCTHSVHKGYPAPRTQLAEQQYVLLLGQ